MRQAEILSVGEELLSGSVVDTNAAYLSRALADAGYSVAHRQTVGDEESEIRSALALAHSRCDLVVVTGGLGPTHDDLTRPAAAAYFGMPLLQDERIAESLRAYFDRRGVTMSESNLLQAQVPEGATVLWNDWGTAPGLFLEKDGKCAVLLPGVPREMKALFENRVLPLIKKEDRNRERCILRFYGVAESRLDELVSHLDCPEKGIGVAPYAGGGEVELHLSASGPTPESAKARLETLREKVLSLVGEHCYGEGDSSLEKELVRACIGKKISLATAESCTGGLLSQRITSVPGASAVFSLGLCTYSEKQKVEKLGVLSSTLRDFGVYSEGCAWRWRGVPPARRVLDWASESRASQAPTAARKRTPWEPFISGWFWTEEKWSSALPWEAERRIGTTSGALLRQKLCTLRLK